SAPFGFFFLFLVLCRSLPRSGVGWRLEACWSGVGCYTAIIRAARTGNTLIPLLKFKRLLCCLI
uniref:Uncharacterized protein n=1 Tax=Oryza brachyantha TaxID=4533 RepID=J3MLG2_ORYBR